MGKRKTALKKHTPNRNKAFKKLREMAYSDITTRSGTEIRLNLYKHLLLNKPYKNQEYSNELYRILRQREENS